MKTNILKFLGIICVIIIFNSSNQFNNTCIIKGKTYGVASKSVFLIKVGEELRFDGIEVPIIDSSFEYKMDLKNSEALYLMYSDDRQRGGGRVMPFFAEPGVINLTLYSENSIDSNKVTGGKLNEEFANYIRKTNLKFNPLSKAIIDSINLLYTTGKYFSDSMNVLMKLSQTAQDSQRQDLIKKMNDLRATAKDISDPTKCLMNKMNKITDDKFLWQEDYVSNGSSIVSYFLLCQDLITRSNNDHLDLIINNYRKYSELYPDHPYTQLVANLLESALSIKIGGKYIDFSAPDINGNTQKLSDKINGKIAILDLWSSWCGPCIAYSRTLIPVYEEFKNSGFTIVGVCADKEKSRLDELIKKENYPWINLVELDKQNNIWEKYGITGAGGKAILIDKEGKVIALQPTAEELRNILKELIK
jgi:peroxiredoxin